MAFQNREGSDLGGPGLTHSPQHCGGRSVKSSAAGILQFIEGAALVGMGIGRAQHSFLCRQRTHSGT